MAGRKEGVGGLAEGEEVFSKAGTKVESQLVFHILSVGHVVVLCCRKHFQICYSISKCFVFRNCDFFLVSIPYISIRFIVDFRVHKITFNEDVCS